MIRPVPDEIWTVEDAMRELKLSRSTLYKLRQQGLPTEKWGLRAVRFRSHRVIAWLDRLDKEGP